MRRVRIALLLVSALVVACAGNPDKQTLAKLHRVQPDLNEVQINNGLDQAMMGYRKFLEDAPESRMTPEAMRRLADLKLEKEFGIRGSGALPVPKVAGESGKKEDDSSNRQGVASIAEDSESERELESRASRQHGIAAASTRSELELPGEKSVEWSGPREAIELYDKILAAYPTYRHNDQVLYQKARAYDELGESDAAIAVTERLIAEYPDSRYIDEVQFRRGEYLFTRKKYFDAEHAYAAVTEMGVSSPYYELALYKLGWALYKQEFHEEALHKYIALLDYKVSTGYDFDQSEDDTDERRIADTYRVISLSFSSLGGPDVVEGYFAATGNRGYENRIYRQLGEFYLEKLRYQDAAGAYDAFVKLHPLHRSSPVFGMRVVEIYEAGGFPKLVLESKKDFAASYGLKSAYWSHFDVNAAPEVLSYLKTNLEDLANHYHAAYQEEKVADDKPENLREALHWYREYLASFPADPNTPAVHYQLADLLLENQDFGAAAREYEHTAYEYPGHERSAAAGYAAIYAHRKNLKLQVGEEQVTGKRDAVASTLRFVDAFPEHEHAAVVLGAAVDDLYAMKNFEQTIATGRKLLDAYPQADLSVRRSAWAAVANAFFDTPDFAQAEFAYARVLEMTESDDPSRKAVVENLAAAIYKQGEQANLVEDYRSAAGHFLRVAERAPTSSIRPSAEYDAGAALIRLEDWAGAASVLEAFRDAHPNHELKRDATRQIASVYQKAGDLSRAGQEYERVANEAEDTEMRREALLTAGELYEASKAVDRALSVYLDYVGQYAEPLEAAVETRFKVASLYEAKQDEAQHRKQLKEIVAIDSSAGDRRSDRIRYLAARSSLVLSEVLYHEFDEVELLQPFEKNLRKKQKRMKTALEAFEGLVDYEVGEVTAGATYFIAEIYLEFSRALLGSERPADLAGAELQEYELALEEEAFPFEERAIGVHEKNLELMVAGVYNAWIDKSLGKLAGLMPGRYAKFEQSSGLIASLDEYAYRTPGIPAPDPDPGVGEIDEVPQSAAPEVQPEPAIEPESAPKDLPIENVAVR